MTFGNRDPNTEKRSHVVVDDGDVDGERRVKEKKPAEA
jgi:hypothetical protein